MREPFLEVQGVQKRYGHVIALADADLTVGKGEVHALLGDNGAGKSTLLKILSGVVIADEGSISLDGKPLDITGPRDVQAAGIETVFQDLALAPNLDPGENVYLGREILQAGLRGKLGFVDRKAMRERAEEELTGLGATIKDYTEPVASLSGGQKQAVAVAKAAVWGQTMLMMDEPTAALGVRQTQQVLDLIRTIKAKGDTSLLLISHNLHDVFEVADRVTVLRLGRTVFEADIADTSIEELTLIMAGIGGAA